MVELSTVVSPFSDPSSIEEAVSSRAPVSCRIALSSDDVELHRALRHAVFVEEQRLFQGTDHDLHDDTADTLCVLGLCGAVACGAVRLYPLDEPGRWKGDRLAVLPPVRHLTLGAALVRFAVETAGARGGREMVASVQVQNVPFFEYLGWRRVGEPFTYVGHPHQQMAIALRPGKPTHAP